MGPQPHQENLAAAGEPTTGARGRRVGPEVPETRFVCCRCGKRCSENVVGSIFSGFVQLWSFSRLGVVASWLGFAVIAKLAFYG
jgi:hypothetical protein